MKCQSCGGEIRLTDEKCPFCGRPVTETAGHRGALKAYRTRTDRTKHKVRSTLSENLPLVISAVVMVVLLAGVCVSYYVADNAYRFRSDAMRRDSVKNYDTYYPEIRRYLEAGDYTGFAAFMGVHNIAEWEAPYDDLNLLSDITGEYLSLASNVEEALMFGEDADIYRPESYISGVQSGIRSFYHEYDRRLEEIEKDPYSVYMKDMKTPLSCFKRIKWASRYRIHLHGQPENIELITVFFTNTLSYTEEYRSPHLSPPDSSGESHSTHLSSTYISP